MPSRKTPAGPSTTFPKRTPAADAGKSAAELIDARIRELADWRGDLLARLRRLITGAGASIAEEWKWNTPVWSCGGIDFPEGGQIDEAALAALVRAAIAMNRLNR